MTYEPGTIGHSVQSAEQEGKDAWLAGLDEDSNPYTKDDVISHTFWLVGWNHANVNFEKIR